MSLSKLVIKQNYLTDNLSVQLQSFHLFLVDTTAGYFYSSFVFFQWIVGKIFLICCIHRMCLVLLLFCFCTNLSWFFFHHTISFSRTVLFHIAHFASLTTAIKIVGLFYGVRGSCFMYLFICKNNFSILQPSSTGKNEAPLVEM